jgi:hypothetical protein
MTPAGLQPPEVVSIKRGAQGFPVWALQRALDDVSGYVVEADGIFGPATETAVKKFQGARKLTTDGIAGPATQRALVGVHVVGEQDDLPGGLLHGFAQMEGGWLVAAVNDKAPGGIDCGAFQRRVYESDYADRTVVCRAFDTRVQARLLAMSLLELRGVYIDRRGTRDGSMEPREKAWRLAALNHNYPAAADYLSRTPLGDVSAYWRSPADWVKQWGFRFPNGQPVQTPMEWCHLYCGILGAGLYKHNGNVTGLVTSWSV